MDTATSVSGLRAAETRISVSANNVANINSTNAAHEVREAVDHVIAELNAGRLRVATREGVGQWTVHQWLKKAVLLSFRLNDNQIIKAGDLGFYDKVKTKFSNLSDDEFKAAGVLVAGVLSPLAPSSCPLT